MSLLMLGRDDPFLRLNLFLSSLSNWEDVEKDSLDEVLDLWRYKSEKMGVMNFFYRVPYAAASCAGDQSQASIYVFPTYAKHDSQSSNDSFRYVPYVVSLPQH